MNDKDLDKVFNSGLKEEFVFSTRERQWESILPRLETNGKKRNWILFSLVLAFSTVAAAFVLKFNSNSATPNTHIHAHTETSETQDQNQTKIDHSTITPQENVDKQLDKIVESEIKSETQTTKPKIELDKEIEPASPLKKEKQENNIVEEYCEPCEEEDKLESKDLQKNQILSQDYMPGALSLDDSKTIVENNETIYTLDELENHNIPMLMRMREPLMPNFVSVNPIEGERRFAKLRISSGVLLDHLSALEFEDRSSPSPYVSFKYDISKRYALGFSYSSQNIDRLLSLKENVYNIPVPEEVYQVGVLDTVALSYHNHTVDFTLDVSVYKTSKLDFGTKAGIQFNSIGSSDIRYTYTTIYGSTYLDDKIKASKHITDYILGAYLEIDLMYGFSMQGEYLFHKYLNHDAYRWPRKHRYKLGISYKI